MTDKKIIRDLDKEVERLGDETFMSEKQARVALLTKKGLTIGEIEEEVGAKGASSHKNRARDKLEKAENTLEYVERGMPDKSDEDIADETFLSENHVKLLKADPDRAYIYPDAIMISDEELAEKGRKSRQELSEETDIDPAAVTRFKSYIRNRVEKADRTLEEFKFLKK